MSDLKLCPGKALYSPVWSDKGDTFSFSFHGFNLK